VLKRADGLWAYQLAVVVDDADQGITHVVRGEDLADNTARQILLQQALTYPTPVYLHTPLVLAPDGHKLSKQNGAEALQLANASQVAAALRSAAAQLGLRTEDVSTPSDILMTCVTQWICLFCYT
jgi:glutamyl-Q tRNA(Asp) synthetase